MFFYYHFRRQDAPKRPTIVRIDEGAAVQGPPDTLFVAQGVQQLEQIELAPSRTLLLLGDPVFRREELSALLLPSGKLDEHQLYASIRGHYYWFLLDNNGLAAGASFGAIFPVYYTATPGGGKISSSALFLAQQIDNPRPDRRNLLERLLFNYPFFHSTWWEGIHLLEAHRYLQTAPSGLHLSGSFDISAHFGKGQGSSPQHLEQLIAAFAGETARFLPEEPFAISFTGGFDGRTLLAAARQAGREPLLTYSFGRPGAADVEFPARQAVKIGCRYQPVLLDRDYLDHHALPAALEFLRRNDYNGNLGRPHYTYAAARLAGETGYILTGNFGSELFRALHQPGVMMSAELIQVFADPGNRWKDVLKNTMQEMGATALRKELDALIADLEQYRSDLPCSDPNQRFYHFVFNEMFRKYFGPELVMQSHYLRNRTPFLSLPFVRALNDTVWSGVHARLFEKAKHRRLKGQQFYAAFIRQADPMLYRLPTGKGYSPADVLEPWRRPLLFSKVFLHKYLRPAETDSNAESAFLMQNRQILAGMLDEERLPGFLFKSLSSMETPPDERWLHWCALGLGWQSANLVSQPANPSLPPG